MMRYLCTHAMRAVTAYRVNNLIWNFIGFFHALCRFCSSDQESLDHMFIHCKHAWNTWTDIIKVGCEMGDPSILGCTFEMVDRLESSNWAGNHMELHPLAVLWTIWIKRNNLIFEDKNINWLDGSIWTNQDEGGLFFFWVNMRVAFWVTTKNVGHKLHYGWLFNQNQEYCWNHLSWVGLFLFVFGFVSVCLCLGVFQLDLWSFGWESDIFFFFFCLWFGSLHWLGSHLGLGGGVSFGRVCQSSGGVVGGMFC